MEVLVELDLMGQMETVLGMVLVHAVEMEMVEATEMEVEEEMVVEEELVE